MRVVRLHGVGDLRQHEEQPPAAAPGRTLVRVAAVGICGSDLHWFAEGSIGDAQVDRPMVLGQEIAGVVEGGPVRGRLVAVDPAVPCGGCWSSTRSHTAGRRPSTTAPRRPSPPTSWPRGCRRRTWCSRSPAPMRRCAGAFLAARPGGRVVLVGIPDGDRTAFRASLARRKGLTMLMSRRMAEVYPRAIRLVEQGSVEQGSVEQGSVDLGSVLTERFGLAGAGAVFDSAASRRGLEVVVTP